MKEILEHLETKPETNLLKRVKKFLKDQEFIKQNLRNGGSFTELESMGFKFGKVDVRNLTTNKI